MRQHFLLLFLAVAILQSCTKDLGTIDVTYTKATAIYGDLETVRNTPLIDAPKEIDNPGKIFVSNDFLLIGEEEKGIHLIDNSDPENPTPIHFINVPGNREFYVVNNTVYAESYYDLVKIDLTNLQQPVLSNRLRNAFGEEIKNDKGETLIGFNFERVTESMKPNHPVRQQRWGQQETYYYDYLQNLIPPSAVPASFAGSSGGAIGSVNRIAKVDNYVYVVSRSKLNTFKDNGALELIASDDVFQTMETIFPDGDRLFIGTRNSMEIFSIENREQPQQMGNFFHGTACDPVYPDGDVAYLTLRTGDFSDCPGDVNALHVLDVTDIQFPNQIQEITMASPYGLSLIGDRLYVGEGRNGIKIFDATDRRNLTLEKSDESVEAYDIIRHPNRTDLILIAGTDGLKQYKVEGGDLSLMSQLLY
ncbi:MAG: hypothetical protein AAGG68_15625 [Bacteroidota bacterium]